MKLKSILLFTSSFLLLSFNQVSTLKGIYIFQGGTYAGKTEGATKDYTLQRNYTDKKFTAYAYQKGMKTQKYEAGDYVISADSCFETETFSSEPTKILGKRVHYAFKIVNGELVLSGILPTGMKVEEHWKRIK